MLETIGKWENVVAHDDAFQKQMNKVGQCSTNSACGVDRNYLRA